LQRLIATRIQHPAILLGTAPDLKTYSSFLTASEMEWDWDVDVKLPDGAQVVICSVPLSDEHWRVIRELKRRHGARVTGIQEIVLPFTPILFALNKLNYFLKTIDELAPMYLGEQWFGPIDRLNDLFPLGGKRVIEFGPFDGAQTAGLVHHGVRELVCIEARAENFIKPLIAKEIFGWDQARLVMDDMHNADEVKYGRFDLAFCHGTYYHSISPFVLLENLVSLSDNIFVGGFVLKEDAPFEIVSYEGEDYRVQPYTEEEGWFTAGVNKTSYYFHPDDLTQFFSSRGYQITLMDDEESEWASNRFYRFFASR
jgi:phospholipid N-methyltransferase